MQLGMIGLGRMGANMIRRADAGGPRGRRLRPLRREPVQQLAGEGAVGADTIEDLVAGSSGRATSGSWCPPASRRRTRSRACCELLDEGDTVIDGGNSYFKDDVRRAKICAEHGIDYVDVGTSGGVWGLERGYCLMIGGPDEVVRRGSTRSSARSRPASATIERTPGPRGGPGHRRAGLPPLRPGRRGALREDGAQRHRVRRDAGLRRGLRHHAERRHRAGRRGPPLRAAAAGHRRGLAPRERRQLLAARPDGDRAGRRPGARRATPASSRTRARGAGRYGGDRGGGARRRARRPRSTPASARARSTPSRRRCCRPCASSSAATSSRRRGRSRPDRSAGRTAVSHERTTAA